MPRVKYTCNLIAIIMTIIVTTSCTTAQKLMNIGIVGTVGGGLLLYGDSSPNYENIFSREERIVVSGASAACAVLAVTCGIIHYKEWQMEEAKIAEQEKINGKEITPDALYSLNSDSQKFDKCFLPLRFNYNIEYNRLYVYDESGNYINYSQFPNDKATFTYISEHPELKFQKEMTSESYKFIFIKKDDGKFYLSEIENFDFKNLEAAQIEYENLSKDYVLFGEGLYKKINSNIQNTVKSISYWDFFSNNPYQFSKEHYYKNEDKHGHVLQWINNNTVLFDFKPNVYIPNAPDSALALITFDSSTDKSPNFNSWDVLYHYEGVYSYTTAYGSKNTVPKFKLIFNTKHEKSNYEYEKNKENTNTRIEYIGSSSSFFMNNAPYSLDKDTIYKDASYAYPKVLQWLDGGCLYDYSGYVSSAIYWDCIVFLSMTEEEKMLLFDTSYDHYYKYLGVYEYITTSGAMNTIPKFKVYFEKK